MDKVLTALRANKEALEIIDGSNWGMVYLDNAKADLKGISANQFAGFLSALKASGLYLPTSDAAFGLVKMEN